MMEVSPVTKDAVQAVWPDVEDYIQMVVERTDGDYNLDDIFGFCLEGKMTMLIAHDGWDVYGVILSEVIKYPQKLVLNAFGLAGRDMDKWLSLVIERFKEGRKAIKADYIKAFVRPGLAKKLAKYGCKTTCHEMVLK